MMNNQINQNEMNRSSGNSFNIFNALNEGERKRTMRFDRENVEQILSSFTSAGSTCQFVYNNLSDNFIYLSKNVYDVLGVNLGDFNALTHLALIHPDDLEHVQHCRDTASYFYSSHVEKPFLLDYKTSYQFRMKDKSGKYKMILHESIPLSLSETGQPVEVLINETDISYITTVNSYRISFRSINGEKPYLNIKNKEDLITPQPATKVLTEREIGILRLLSEGMSSKEIAGNLHIAYDTVRTHRNNILKKTKLRTLAQVISCYTKEGLI